MINENKHSEKIENQSCGKYRLLIGNMGIVWPVGADNRHIITIIGSVAFICSTGHAATKFSIVANEQYGRQKLRGNFCSSHISSPPLLVPATLLFVLCFVFYCKYLRIGHQSQCLISLWQFSIFCLSRYWFRTFINSVLNEWTGAARVQRSSTDSHHRLTSWASQFWPYIRIDIFKFDFHRCRWNYGSFSISFFAILVFDPLRASIRNQNCDLVVLPIIH